VLVLSRQKDETIMIGDDVEITVVDIRGDKVRLGIKAPPHIPVHRKEVYEAIKRENRAAAQVSPDDLKSVATSRTPKTGPGPQPPAAAPAPIPPVIEPTQEADPNGSKSRRPGKPADSNNASSNHGKSVEHSGGEGTPPTGS
jgi:carbon storage regulator